jgi:hypothetical protein
MSASARSSCSSAPPCGAVRAAGADAAHAGVCVVRTDVRRDRVAAVCVHAADDRRPRAGRSGSPVRTATADRPCRRPRVRRRRLQYRAWSRCRRHRRAAPDAPGLPVRGIESTAARPARSGRSTTSPGRRRLNSSSTLRSSRPVAEPPRRALLELDAAGTQLNRRAASASSRRRASRFSIRTTAVGLVLRGRTG